MNGWGNDGSVNKIVGFYDVDGLVQDIARRLPDAKKKQSEGGNEKKKARECDASSHQLWNLPP
jgi:hypothetical protein